MKSLATKKYESSREPSHVLTNKPCLYVFHHAGGSAKQYEFFHSFLLDAWEIILIDLPGRASQSHLPLINDATQLLNYLIDVIQQHSGDRSVAFFGHSFGALLAFHLAQFMCERNFEKPVWLGLSGKPPFLHDSNSFLNSKMTNGELSHGLRQLGGTHPIVFQNKIFLKRYLEVVRADMQACEQLTCATKSNLNIKTSLFSGHDDILAQPKAMRRWYNSIPEESPYRIYNGNHFYFKEQYKSLLNDIRQDLIVTQNKDIQKKEGNARIFSQSA